MTTAGPQRQPLPRDTAPVEASPRPDRAPASLVTACGRRISVAALCLGGAGGPFPRIALDIGPERDGASRAWAGLSPQEARSLAFLLLEQAAGAEHRAAGRG
ncbi:hypothetical protein [Streptomyces sp. NPDC001380]|uniref:hypothetical protein n=1 Tax=Streptomyces sp. NPDC001380 TaxID=3364566 RepID=UPI00367AAE13